MSSDIIPDPPVRLGWLTKVREWRSTRKVMFHDHPCQVRSGMGARAAAAHRRAHPSVPLPRPIPNSGRSPGPAPTPLTIPSCDLQTALTMTSWDAPANDSILPNPSHLGYGEQDHPLENAPHGHRSAVGALLILTLLGNSWFDTRFCQRYPNIRQKEVVAYESSRLLRSAVKVNPLHE